MTTQPLACTKCCSLSNYKVSESHGLHNAPLHASSLNMDSGASGTSVVTPFKNAGYVALLQTRLISGFGHKLVKKQRVCSNTNDHSFYEGGTPPVETVATSRDNCALLSGWLGLHGNSLISAIKRRGVWATSECLSERRAMAVTRHYGRWHLSTDYKKRYGRGRAGMQLLKLRDPISAVAQGRGNEIKEERSEM